MTWLPFVDQLRVDLDAIEQRSLELLDASSIDYRGGFNRSGGVVFIAPDYDFGKATPEVRQLQMRLLPMVDLWLERLHLLFRGAAPDLRLDVDQAGQRVRGWISRNDHNWSLPSTIDKARVVVGSDFEKLRSLLDVFGSDPDAPTVAIPDTNVLLEVPEVSMYPELLGVDRVDVFLVAPVLAELDMLKNQGRTPQVREKAREASTWIKSIRNRGGSLAAGVEYLDGIRIFGRPRSPVSRECPAPWTHRFQTTGS
jgi:hypothetical protein